MGSIGKFGIIIGASVAAALVHAAARGLSWQVALEQARRVQELKQKVGDRHAELRQRLGITLEQFREHMLQGGVVIDARPREEFEKAHLALETQPPVLNVEPHDLDRHLERLMPFQASDIVIYCTSDTCELGEQLFIAMEPYGFASVRIYFSGWAGIVAAGLPTQAGADTWTGFDSAPGEAVAPSTDDSADGSPAGSDEAAATPESGDEPAEAAPADAPQETP